MTPPSFTGQIRHLDPKRDIARVADLVEAAFGLKNDPEGSSVVSQMRNLATFYRNYPLATSLATTQTGFVWEEAGQLVGNISLIPFHRRLTAIFLIANVAVAPEFRGRGIAKALTQHALRYTQQWGRTEIWLQVRSDNQVAIQMYQNSDFHFFSALSQWAKPADLNLGGSPLRSASGQFEMRKRQREDWPQQKIWLDWAYPQETRWYQSVDLGLFSPWAWLNPLSWGQLFQLEHLCQLESGRMRGVLSLQRSEAKTENLWLCLPKDPDLNHLAREMLKQFLLNHWQGKRIFTEYPLGVADEAFTSNGFTKLRDLNWMRYR
jgi:ribosomal protein S18 acetylase RimI-like enzyme